MNKRSKFLYDIIREIIGEDGKWSVVRVLRSKAYKSTESKNKVKNYIP